MSSQKGFLVVAVEDVAKAISEKGQKEPSPRRIQIGAGLITLGNAAVGVLILNQIFQKSFDLKIFILGIIAFVISYLTAIVIMARKKENVRP